nr:hypothetical protein [Microbacterium bovistercoris]
MDEHQFGLDLHTATIRQLLVELQAVEHRRQEADCFRLRSRERGICAELRLRRHQMGQIPETTGRQADAASEAGMARTG